MAWSALLVVGYWLASTFCVVSLVNVNERWLASVAIGNKERNIQTTYNLPMARYSLPFYLRISRHQLSMECWMVRNVLNKSDPPKLVRTTSATSSLEMEKDVKMAQKWVDSDRNEVQFVLTADLNERR
jgi:hypothetical protein